MSTRYVSTTETAKLIRKALKEALPHTKFFVRSQKYAGGASIDVRSFEMFDHKLAHDAVDKFSGTVYDTHADMRTYRDGELDGETVRFGADYVFIHENGRIV